MNEFLWCNYAKPMYNFSKFQFRYEDDNNHENSSFEYMRL